jgi:hypothetical protein
MTTFDGAARDAVAPASDSPQQPTQQPAAEPSNGEVEPVSALEMLRSEVARREAEDETLEPVEVPGLDVRLMCSTDIPVGKWEAWQRKSIPKGKRNPGPLDLQQGTLSIHVLLGTCQHLEYKDRSGTWQVLTGKDQQPLALDSEELLRQFGQMDSRAMLKKLFGRDSWLLTAGRQVIDAAGYGDPGEASSEDPTE